MELCRAFSLLLLFHDFAVAVGLFIVSFHLNLPYLFFPFAVLLKVEIFQLFTTAKQKQINFRHSQRPK